MLKDLIPDEIQIPGAGKVKAKYARDFQPGEVIQQAHGYTLKIEKIISEDGDKITFEVEHLPQESEYWDWQPTHQQTFRKNDLLGIAKRHGNEGLC